MIEPANLPEPEAWCNIYFGRGCDVIGRLISHDGRAFGKSDLLIATVNPALPDGAVIATEIAAALTLKFTKEVTNV